MSHFKKSLFHQGGESGSADTARDPRGFAIKFYTDEGNWDLVGNNTPIFFIRDPIFVNDIVYIVYDYYLSINPYSSLASFTHRNVIHVLI